MQSQARMNPQSTSVSTTGTSQVSPGDDQSLIGNAAVQEQMNAAQGPETLLGTTAAPKNLTPGILYSNTSTSDLNNEAGSIANWNAQGYELSTQYTMPLTLSKLALMGQHGRLFTNGKPATPVKDRRTDIIAGPGGTVSESGSTTFVLRGGPDVGENEISLDVANNGCLNLMRLATSADKMVKAFGLAFGKSNQLAYGTENFEVVCTMTMGNDIEEDDARDYGFVAGIPAELRKRVDETIDMVTAGAALKATNPKSTTAEWSAATTNAFNPFDTEAVNLRAEKRAYAVEGEEFPWVQGDEIGERSAGRFQGIWGGAGGRIKNTWFAVVPDVSDLVNGLEVAIPAGKLVPDDADLVEIQNVVTACLQRLVASDDNFDPSFLDLDPNLKGKYIEHYRKQILAAGKDKLADRVRAAMLERREGEKGSVTLPQGPDPAAGSQSNVEGGVR